MTTQKINNENEKTHREASSKNVDNSEHTEEIRKIISSDMGNVQRWGLPLILLVVILCFLLLYLIKIPVGDHSKDSVRLIVLLMQAL